MKADLKDYWRAALMVWTMVAWMALTTAHQSAEVLAASLVARKVEMMADQLELLLVAWKVHQTVDLKAAVMARWTGEPMADQLAACWDVPLALLKAGMMAVLKAY